MKIKTILILCLSASAAFAAEGGPEHGHEGIPWMTIFYQALNVSIMFGGLIYFLKDGVKAHFQGKKQEFLSAFEKANTARKAAEAEKLQIEVKLSKLDSTLDETISRAKKEAAEMIISVITYFENQSKVRENNLAQKSRPMIISVFSPNSLLGSRWCKNDKRSSEEVRQIIL